VFLWGCGFFVGVCLCLFVIFPIQTGTATSSPKYWMFLAGDKCLLAAVCVFLVLARVIFFYSPLI
jgi:hypothetical protein